MLVRARAPLRLGLAGGGTDVAPYCNQYGGYVLNVTINMHAYAIIETLEDSDVIFNAPDIQKTYSDFAKASYPIEGDLILHKAVYNRIIKDFNNDIPIPMKLTTYCQAPPGSGLGSSSTMVVAMIKAFVELLNLPLGEYEIAHLAYEIERKDANLDGGRQDQYAAAFGGVNFIEFYDDDRVIVNPLRVKNWIMSELEASLILFYTNVSRDSEIIIKKQANNVKQDKSTAVEAMHKIKQNALYMKENLLRGDIDGLAQNLLDGWAAKKETAKEVTNAHIDAIYDTAMKAGAKAGKISGAGGGGFIMFIVDPIKRMDVLRALKAHDGYSIECNFTTHGTQGWRI